MAFGLAIRDSAGRLVMDTDRESFHYWGKWYITPGSNQYGTSRVLNITSAMRPVVFCNIEWTAANSNPVDCAGQFSVYFDSSGYLVVDWGKSPIIASQGMSKNVLGNLVLYIFLPCAYMPTTSWGFRMYSAAGVRVYDTSRPQLQICGMMAGGSFNFFNRTPGRVASYIGGDAWSLNHSSGLLLFSRYVCLPPAGGYVYGNLFRGSTFGNQSLGYTANNPLIDLDYYNQFPSLGSF